MGINKRRRSHEWRLLLTEGILLLILKLNEQKSIFFLFISRTIRRGKLF